MVIKLDDLRKEINKKEQKKVNKVKAEIKKYNRMKNWSTGLVLGGFALAMTSAIAPSYLTNNNLPGIVKTYENAQTSLQTSENTRKNLSGKLLILPYQNQEFRQYQQNNKTNKINFELFQLGGLFTFLIGTLGGVIAEIKEDDLELYNYKK